MSLALPVTPVQQGSTLNRFNINKFKESNFLLRSAPNLPVLKALEILHRKMCILQIIIKLQDGFIEHP